MLEHAGVTKNCWLLAAHEGVEEEVVPHTTVAQVQQFCI